VQESDWNCGSAFTPNHQKKPFNDVRVCKALLLAIDQRKGARAPSKIAIISTNGAFSSGGGAQEAERKSRKMLRIKHSILSPDQVFANA